uniref:Gustatory receptor n=1 Tax=Lutzomyia longipalpis TaxID=7200 RepID=A0A3F2ZD81_LUTLO
MILTRDLGILFIFQKLITIPNYGLSKKCHPCIRKLIIGLRCLPFACSTIIVLYQCFSYIGEKRVGFPEVSDVAFILSEFDFIFMQAIMGLIAIYAITHNKTHIRFLNLIEIYEKNYSAFRIPPRKFMKLWNSAKFLAIVLHMIFLNTLNLAVEENYYREDTLFSYFFYNLSIAIVDIEGIYVASLARLIGDFFDRARIDRTNKQTSVKVLFPRDSMEFLNTFNDAFGIILFFSFIAEFICWCLSCFFIIWRLSSGDLVEHNDCLIVECTTWILRSVFIITHIGLACDHFSTTIFDYKATLNHLSTYQSEENENKINKFVVNQFQLKKLHQTLLGLNVSIFRSINVNSSTLFKIFTSVVSHIVILMQFKDMEEQRSQ